MSLLVLTASETSSVTARFTPDELVALIASVFSKLSAADPGIDQPHRTVVETQNHTALFMPSRIAPAGTAIKLVSVPKDNAEPLVKARGLPASTIVLDERSGGVRAIVNARRLTALRNAAGSLLATRLLLPKDPAPRTIVAIGAGAQIRAHLTLFLSAYPSLQTCAIFNRSQNARLNSLVAFLTQAFPRVHVAAGLLSPDDGSALREAIGDAHIIITATSSTAPLFPSHYVRAETHLCLIGSYKPEMHEIDTDLVRRAGKVVVDQKSACLQEAGELISAKLDASDLTEIGQLYEYHGDERSPSWTPRADAIEQVRGGGDVTIFKSVGLGVQDVSIACAVVDRAIQENIGTIIEDYDAPAMRLFVG